MQKGQQVIGIAVVVSMVVLTPLYAAEEGTKNGHTRRNVSIHPVGAVHRMGDWVATRRMPKEERQTGMEQRRAQREILNAEEKVKRAQRRAEKEVVFDADKKSRAE